MARIAARPSAGTVQVLAPAQQTCWQCGRPMWVAYHSRRTVATLDCQQSRDLPYLVIA